MDKKKLLKTLRNLSLFLLLIGITFSVIFKDKDVTQIYELLGTVKIQYILIAVFAMCIYILCEAINIGRTLKALGENSNIFKNIKYALIGFFFSGITPAASGGQPMQIYYMHKENISVANSTLTLLLNLTSMQIVTISLAVISVLVNHRYMNTTLRICFIVGILLNLSALTLLLLSILSKTALRKLIDLVIKIMKKLKLKNIEQKIEKLNQELEKYHQSSKYIKTHKKDMIKIVLTTFVQFISLYSVSYWVYRSFGLNGMNIIQLISIQSILYGTVSGIPSPGAVGVTEGGFLELFKTIMPQELINSAMLLNRGINFYLLIIISGAVTIFNIIKNQKKLKKEKN